MKRLNTISKNFEKLLDEAVATIIETMNKQNVACISFINNGNHSHFDVDRAYTTIEDVNAWEETRYISREVVAVRTDGEYLYIAVEDWLDEHQIFLLEDTAIFTKEEFDEKEWLDYRENDVFQNIKETLDCATTIIDLTATIDQVLNGVLKGKAIKENLTLD